MINVLIEHVSLDKFEVPVLVHHDGEYRLDELDFAEEIELLLLKMSFGSTVLGIGEAAG